MRYVNVNVLSAVDTVSQTGVTIDADQLIDVSFQAIFGDTAAAGTLLVQMSNDLCPYSNLPANFTPTHWSAYPSATTTVVAGVVAPIIITQVCARWLRVVFTSSVAGTSTIDVNLFGLSV